MLQDMCEHEERLEKEFRKKYPLWHWKRFLGIVCYYDYLGEHLRNAHGEGEDLLK